MKNRFFVFFVACFMLGGAGLAYATDFSSTNFTAKDPVIALGAGFSTSSSFRLWSSIGQASIGTSTATNFILKAGFLYFPGVVVALETATTTVPAGPVVIVVPPGGGGIVAKILPPKIISLVDFNGDGKVDSVDLSILLFYYGRAGAGIDRYDLNKNGAVDIIDISIFLYYWTD